MRFLFKDLEKGLQSLGLRPLERSNLIIKENDYNPDNSEVSLKMKPESESWEPETITNKASAFAFYSETFEFFFKMKEFSFNWMNLMN